MSNGDIKVLIACEESQEVCKAFRSLGVESYSCDLQECSGGHPEWHIKQDVIPLLNGSCRFVTCDCIEHNIVGKWDMIIAFPPCTDLCVSGARYFERKRADGTQQKSIDFFMQFVNADCEKIAIENPIGIMSREYRKPDQIIQPYWFGDKAQKSTCLWLKGLPKLEPTNIVENGDFYEWVDKNGVKKREAKWLMDALKAGADRAKIRSKTFQGVAKAMASQWTN